MKKHILSVMIMLLPVLFLAGCSDSIVDLAPGETPLALTVDNQSLELSVAKMSKNAVTFSWTSGTNKGTNCALNYIFQMDRQGNNFAGGYSADLGKRVYSLTFTHLQMNELLLKTFGAGIKEQMNLEARIVAIPADESVEEQTAGLTALAYTTFKPLPEKLYLFGSATPGGWDLNAITEMNSVANAPGNFVWTGTLTAGEFKIMTGTADYIPSYNRDPENAGKLLYRESYDQPDEKFVIEGYGGYRIAVDLVKMTISISKETGPRFNDIYFVGSFTGWSFVKMRKDPTNPFIFRHAGVFEWNGGGEFKFATADGSWDNMYHPSVANAPYTHTAVILSSPDDNKWLLKESECGKPYKLYLDITESKEKMVMTPFVPFENLWMVGDATSGGWSISDGTALIRSSDYIFTWTGTLTQGEIKISCDKQSDWMGAWFMAYADAEEPAGETQMMTFVDKKNDPSQGGVDRKWKITSAGRYTITVDQLNETITFDKL